MSSCHRIFKNTAPLSCAIQPCSGRPKFTGCIGAPPPLCHERAPANLLTAINHGTGLTRPDSDSSYVLRRPGCLYGEAALSCFARGPAATSCRGVHHDMAHPV